jgi:hypothetical protein
LLELSTIFHSLSTNPKKRALSLFSNKHLIDHFNFAIKKKHFSLMFQRRSVFKQTFDLIFCITKIKSKNGVCHGLADFQTND